MTGFGARRKDVETLTRSSVIDKVQGPLSSGHAPSLDTPESADLLGQADYERGGRGTTSAIRGSEVSPKYGDEGYNARRRFT